MQYVNWDEKKLADLSDESIEDAYDQGYVFTRLGKGIINQTRSLRIDLEKFELSSENRRILRKSEKLKVKSEKLPLVDYDYRIHKMGKVFYTKKFGKGTMSASKIKEMLTEPEDSNFNVLFIYSQDGEKVGYCICLETQNILHYSYPFYNLEYDRTSIGIGMMTLAVKQAREDVKKYIYLGSYKDDSSKYKIQFKGIEWFDGKSWLTDSTQLKDL